MAGKRIKDLATRSAKLLTGDAYLVADGTTTVDKVPYSTLAKELVEEYNQTELAGQVQTPKAAIDAINTTVGGLSTAVEALEAKAPAFMGAYPTVTNDADLVTITDGADDIPIKKGIFRISPVQAGSGDPAPDNVRTIYGFTKQDIYRTGKNLWGGQAVVNGVQKNIQAAVVDTGEKTVAFAANATVKPSRNSFIDFKFTENTQYTFIITLKKTTGSGSNIRIYYVGGSYDDFGNVEEAGAKETLIFVSDAGKTIERVGKVNQSGSTYIYYDETGVFEGVHTAEEFEAFNGEIIPVAFPVEAGTVYSGWVEVAEDGTAKLKVNREKITIDENTSLSLTANNTHGYMMVRLGDVGYVVGGYENVICNVLPSKQISSPNTFSGISVNNSTAYNRAQILFRVEGLITGEQTSAEAIQAYQNWLANLSSPMEVIYKLSTPVEYDLDPITLKTVLGLNNIYADTGSTELTYRADTKLYIDNAVASLQALILENND